MAQRYSIYEGPGLLDLLMHLGQCDPKFRKPLIFKLLEEHGDGYLKSKSFIADGLCRVEDDPCRQSSEFVIRGRMMAGKGEVTHFSGQYNITSRQGYIEED